MNTFQLCDCTNTLLTEIANDTLKQKDVAQTYRLAMESSSPTDWSAVNRAIIDRWSHGGLLKIKQLAHSGKAFDRANVPPTTHTEEAR